MARVRRSAVSVIVERLTGRLQRREQILLGITVAVAGAYGLIVLIAQPMFALFERQSHALLAVRQTSARHDRLLREAGRIGAIEDSYYQSFSHVDADILRLELEDFIARALNAGDLHIREQRLDTRQEEGFQVMEVRLVLGGGLPQVMNTMTRLEGAPLWLETQALHFTTDTRDPAHIVADVELRKPFLTSGGKIDFSGEGP